MGQTPRQLWDDAEDGQAFVTWWYGDDDSIDPDGTVWIKGNVGELAWNDLIWIAPIEIGEKVYS